MAIDLAQLRNPGQVFSAPGELDYRDTGALSGGQGGMQEIYDDILQAALLKIDPTFVNRTPFQSLLQNSFGADGRLEMSPGEAVAQALSKSGLANAGAGINYARSWDTGQPDFIQKQYDSARNTGQFGTDWLDLAGENLPLIIAAATAGLGGFPGAGAGDGMAFGGESVTQGAATYGSDATGALSFTGNSPNIAGSPVGSSSSLSPQNEFFQANNPVGNSSFNPGIDIIPELGTPAELGGTGASGVSTDLDQISGLGTPDELGGTGPSGVPTGIDSILNQIQNGLSEGLTISEIIKKIPGLSEIFGTGDYKFPFGEILGGLLSSYGASKQRNDLKEYLDKALTYSDPFHDQRPQYQTQFRNLTQNPINFFSDPAISKAINFQQDATQRRLSGQGYNMSGNMADAVSEVGQREAFKQYMPYADMIGKAAGAFTGPGQSGKIKSIMGSKIAGQNQIIMGGLGTAFNEFLTGTQPTANQQRTGTPANQNLWQWITGNVA